MDINWTNVTFSVTAATLFAYYVNSFVNQYQDFVNEEDDDESPQNYKSQALNNLRRGGKGKKQQSASGMNQERKEIQDLFYSGQKAIEDENFPLALSIFERVEELTQNSNQNIRASALSHLFKISTMINNSDLTIKYAKKIIDYFGKPESQESLLEALKFNEILVDRLVAVGKITEAANTIKSIVKKYKLNDRQLTEQYAILSTIYQSNMEITNNQELLETIQKFIQCAKNTKDSKLQINAYFDLYTYYAMVGDIEGLKNAQKEIEEILPQQPFGYFKSTSDILLKYEHYPEFVLQRQKLIDFIRENPSEMSLDPNSLENLINNFKFEIGSAHMELKEEEKAKSIFDEIVKSEYFSHTPKTKSKIFTVEKAKSKAGSIRVKITTKNDIDSSLLNGVLVSTLEYPTQEETLIQEQSLATASSNSVLKYKIEPVGFEPSTPALIKFDLYKDQDKSELVNTFYQLISPEAPVNPIPDE